MGTDLVVIKVGGDVNPDLVLDDVAALTAAGLAGIVVHGGGVEADRLARRLGVEMRVIQSPDGTRSRRTDAAALEVLTQALLGVVKPRLVTGLRARGVSSLGLSGADGSLVTAERRRAVRCVDGDRVHLVRDDRSGRVTAINADLLHLLMGAGFVPVVSPPACTTDGDLLNVDADQVAARVASAVGATALVLLTDMPGVLADPDDPETVLHELSEMPASATGRMRHKVRAALAARCEVPAVVIASGLVGRPVEMALSGAGTVIAQPKEDG